MRQMTPAELAQQLEAGERPLLLDVREPWEFERCHIAGSQLVPMRTIPARHAELDRAQPVVVICHHGGRSMQVGMFLEAQGFQDVINLSGGVAEWARSVDPTMPTY